MTRLIPTGVGGGGGGGEGGSTPVILKAVTSGPVPLTFMLKIVELRPPADSSAQNANFDLGESDNFDTTLILSFLYSPPP